MGARRWCAGLMVVAWGACAAGQALAQPAQRPQSQATKAAPLADPQEKARYQITVMEGVLETAVQRGTMLLTRQWRALAPEMLFSGGSARARGFRLDGYGLFFAVDVPGVQQSVIWTWRTLDRDAAGASAAVQALRAFIQGVNDPVKRKELEQNLRRLEVHAAPFARPGDGATRAGTGDAAVPDGQTKGSATVSAPLPSTQSAPVAPMADPYEEYTNAVKNALIEAMLDYSQSLPLAADESLTVAARASNVGELGADDLGGELVTYLFRIKGADLQALYSGRITRDEARKRIEVREY